MASPVLRMSMSGALCVRKRPIALTRRSGIPPCGIADCAPVQCCVRPVLAPAQAFVRAGERRGECGIRTRRGRLIRAVRMFCARRVCFYGSAGVVALDVRQSLRLCRGFLPRFTPVFFPLSGKKRRLAVSCVPVPPGRDRHSRVFVVSVRLSALAGSFRVCTFLYGDPDGLPGRGDGVTRGDGVGGAAFVRFYAATLALLCFPPGVRWGCAPQTCAKESSTLWTLFTLRRGCVGADSAVRRSAPPR